MPVQPGTGDAGQQGIDELLRFHGPMISLASKLSHGTVESARPRNTGRVPHSGCLGGTS